MIHRKTQFQFMLFNFTRVYRFQQSVQRRTKYCEQALKNFPEGGPQGTMLLETGLRPSKYNDHGAISKGHFGNTLKLVSNGSFVHAPSQFSTQTYYKFNCKQVGEREKTTQVLMGPFIIDVDSFFLFQYPQARPGPLHVVLKF